MKPYYHSKLVDLEIIAMKGVFHTLQNWSLTIRYGLVLYLGHLFSAGDTVSIF